MQEALKLTDPRDLSPDDERRWRQIFLGFLAGVSVRGGGKPMILKSPTHGARVSTLRELLPDPRFLLIVRDPMSSFESVVRMWRKMFELYSLREIPSDDSIREAVLADRPRFEAKLASATADLPTNRFAKITYESLIANPVGVIEQLYERLELGDFGPVRHAISAETQRRSGYQAKGRLPSELWRKRLQDEWSAVLANYVAIR